MKSWRSDSNNPARQPPDTGAVDSLPNALLEYAIRQANGDGHLNGHAQTSSAEALEQQIDTIGPRFVRRRWPRPSRVGISLVIPALNEERNIGWVLERIPELVDEVILVDGASTDQTVAVSRAIRQDIRVVGQDRPGKGAALRAGFEAARGEVIVVMDADCSMDPHEIGRFVTLIREGYDLVKGSRFLEGGGTDDMEAVRRMGNGVLNGLVNVLYRAEFTDLCYGYLAFRRNRLDDLRLRADGFEIETEIVCRALKASLRIAEVPSFEGDRAHGESNLRTWRDGGRVLGTLLRHRFGPAVPRASRTRTEPLNGFPKGFESGHFSAWTAAETAGNGTATVPATAQRRTLSVVICAFSEARWEQLLAAIDSCRKQTVPPLEIMVVVDHNPALLDRLRREVPDVTTLESAEERGLSGARNSGVRASSGEVVAFLDDDAVAEPDWLEQLSAGYDEEAVIGVGGLVEPVWPERRPRGMPPEFDWVIGCSYRGMPVARSPVRNMIGANMSFRREALTSVGGFRSDMGRIGSRPLGCEETELCIRVRQQRPEAVILYEPRARVMHRVTPERTRWRYFHSRCYAEGLSKAVVAERTGKGDGLASERVYALRTLPLAVLRGIADTLSGRDLAGVVRGLAVVSGLLITTLGYVVGRARAAAEAGGSR